MHRQQQDLTAIKQYVDGIDAGLTTLVEGKDAQKLAAGAQTLQAMGTVGSKEQPSLEACGRCSSRRRLEHLQKSFRTFWEKTIRMLQISRQV